MLLVTWRAADGVQISAEVDPGANLMRAAAAAGVPGIFG